MTIYKILCRNIKLEAVYDVQMNFQILSCSSNMYKVKISPCKTSFLDCFITLLGCSYFFKGSMFLCRYKLCSSAKTE